MNIKPNTITRFLSIIFFTCYMGAAMAESESKPEEKAPADVAPQLLPYVITGNLVFISGQLPMVDGEVTHTGKLGEDVTVEQGYAAAKLAAENVLMQLEAAVGSLDKVKRAVKVTGFVNATPDFTQHPQVINGASEAIIAALGERGQHARLAVGAPSLPLGVSVEVEAIFELN